MKRMKLIMIAPQANGVGTAGQDFSSLSYKYLHNTPVFIFWPTKPKNLLLNRI